MSESESNPNQPAAPAASLFAEPVGHWIAGRLLSPPARPGLLAGLGKYEVVRLLGAGGMGIVFLARDPESGGDVAIKLLKPEFIVEPRVVHRFLVEARHLQSLKHPNLVSASEVCDRREGPYFVMPYFEKGSLARLIKPGVALAKETILEMSLQLAEALRFIHSKGLIHGDVKPGNILLGTEGRICLADFGLARTVFNDSMLNVDQAHCEGTAPYMSPAVAAGEAEDTRCDIYAFGAVLYEMLSGQPPYEGQTVKAILQRILAGLPKPIRALNAKADSGLVLVAEAAMAREHRDRYANMRDALSDLERVREGKQPAGPHAIKIGWPWPVPKKVWVTPAIVASLALAAWFIWPRSKLEVVRQFTSPQVSNWAGAVPAQWDGSRGSELLVTEDKSLYPFTADGAKFWKWTCSEPMDGGLSLGMVTDVDGDNMEEAFVFWTYGSELRLAVVNQHPREVRRFEATGRERHPANRWATSMLVPLRLIGPEGVREGRRYLLAALQTGYGGGDSPRGLCCFDYDTQQLLWCYRTGPSLRELNVLDLDGDGLLDFLLGSHSPQNTNRAPDGTDDFHSYLFAISSEGKRLWSEEMAGGFSTAHPIVSDLDGDGRQEILAWATTPEKEYTNAISSGGRLVRFDYKGTKVAIGSTDAGLLACTAVDLDGDGKQEIVCGDYEGAVYLFDSDLNLRRKLQLLHRPRDTNALYTLISPFLTQAGRLLPGPSQQLVVASAKHRRYSNENPGYTDKPQDRMAWEDVRIVVLGPDLRVLASVKVADERHQQLNWAVRVADMDGDGVDEIVSLTDKVQILKLRTR